MLAEGNRARGGRQVEPTTPEQDLIRARQSLVKAEANVEQANTYLKEVIARSEKGSLDDVDLEYLRGLVQSEQFDEGSVRFMDTLLKGLEQQEQTPATVLRIQAARKHLEALGKFLAAHKLILKGGIGPRQETPEKPALAA